MTTIDYSAGTETARDAQHQALVANGILRWCDSCERYSEWLECSRAGTEHQQDCAEMCCCGRHTKEEKE